MSELKVNPADIEIKDFQYDLPENRIAKFPLEERDQSKLLIYQSGEIQENIYHEIANYIPSGSLMISNQAKVVHARLQFQKSTGGRIEIFCLEPSDRYPDITTAMGQKDEVYWKCLLKGASKWKDNSALQLLPISAVIQGKSVEISGTAHKVEREGHSFVLQFKWKTSTGESLSFSEFLEYAGEMPIPPYLKREAEESDETRYQTIFAHHEGSVAAPTAGLHFTEHILTELKNKGVDMGKLTLHVGAGTFMPVKSDKMEGHEMHSEWIEIPLQLLLQVKEKIESGQKIICIGTTSARTLESAYWIGVQMLKGEWKDEHKVAVHQWYPYEQEKEFAPKEAIEALINYYQQNDLNRLITRTQLIIAPGYNFKFLDGLITNFHQPASTLLLMISALVGSDWKKIYHYAMENDFRFLSYGDGSLLWK